MGSSRLVHAGVVATCLVATLAFTSTPAQAVCRMTPEGRVLVMSNNVFEAGKGDARKSADMRNFVTRMGQMAPHNRAPDIFLVQEVRKSAVWKIKRLMEKRFSCNYTIPVNAGKSPWKWLRKYTRLKGRDTAIIVNADSMNVQEKGFLTHPYERKQAGRGEKVKVKKTAWVQVIEQENPSQNRGRVRVSRCERPLPQSRFIQERENQQKSQKEILRGHREGSSREGCRDGSKYNNVMHVIGGDFNVKRHNGSASNPTLPLSDA